MRGEEFEHERIEPQLAEADRRSDSQDAGYLLCLPPDVEDGLVIVFEQLQTALIETTPFVDCCQAGR